MLALKSTSPERVFVPIIPLRREHENPFEKAATVTKMASKNESLLNLMAAFELK
ncbi:MAG: hypothetical protein ACI9IP_002765 [Arcticibacterium sp.]|jgi:hypothetical protein